MRNSRSQLRNYHVKKKGSPGKLAGGFTVWHVCVQWYPRPSSIPPGSEVGKIGDRLVEKPGTFGGFLFLIGSVVAGKNPILSSAKSCKLWHLSVVVSNAEAVNFFLLQAEHGLKALSGDSWHLEVNKALIIICNGVTVEPDK